MERKKEGRLASVLTGSETIEPASGAKPAELIPTSHASHVVATFRKLDHFIALWATLESAIVECTENEFSRLVNLTRAFMSKPSAGFASLTRARRAGDVLSGVRRQCQRLGTRGTGTIESRTKAHRPITLTSE